MATQDVPDWWSQRDIGLLRMTFGGRFRVVGALRGGNRGSFGRMLVALDIQAARGADDAYVVVKAVELPDEEQSAMRSFVNLVRGTTRSKMWEKEVAAAAALHHRTVGRIIASGEENGYVWTAAPYYSPGSLTRWIERQERDGDPLQLGLLLTWATDIATALDVAHSSPSRIIHGDLKPDNIVLNGPHPVVIDWGLARLADPRGGQRSTGLPRGTMYYGAPELYTERTVFTGPYAPYVDLWSFGATLYRLLTGESPLWRNSGGVHDVAELAEMVKQGEIVVAPLRTLLPDLPSEVAETVHRLLSIEPADRSASAEPWAAAGDLRRHLAWLSEIVARRGKSSMPIGEAAVLAAQRKPTATPEPDAVPATTQAAPPVGEPTGGTRTARTGAAELAPTELDAVDFARRAAEVALTEQEGPFVNGTVPDVGVATAPIELRTVLRTDELPAPVDPPSAGRPLNGRPPIPRPAKDIPTEPGPGLPPA